MMVMNTALVADVSGVVGSPIAETLAVSGVWQVIGLSKWVPAEPLPDVTCADVDLVDSGECRQFADNFYYRREDFVRQRGGARGW